MRKSIIFLMITLLLLIFTNTIYASEMNEDEISRHEAHQRLLQTISDNITSKNDFRKMYYGRDLNAFKCSVVLSPLDEEGNFTIFINKINNFTGNTSGTMSIYVDGYVVIEETLIDFKKHNGHTSLHVNDYNIVIITKEGPYSCMKDRKESS